MAGAKKSSSHPRKASASPRATRGRTAATPRPAGAEVQRHRGKPLEGRLKAGADFEPGSLSMAPAAGGEPTEYDRPRPAKTRFPIDFEQYASLKRESASLSAPRLATGEAT